ncbi:hypothetical protein C6P40_003460 [Pichia californica]|uniref:C2H2-type domain-containing protein n=1 Tax=Pichia californica TaxID=460514 RepID=A0A9P6WJ54_9ASCO|nr:hypothetical protein C6P42_003286 [[Candida] californica]KAG0686738.1 hypothetical protein C6P40_003460 [[Candida] californica]
MNSNYNLLHDPSNTFDIENAKPALNPANSLSCIFFNNIYNEVSFDENLNNNNNITNTTSNNDNINTNTTNNIAANLDLFKSTPRCSTPIYYENLMFANTSLQNHQNVNDNDLSKKNIPSADQYENLFAYPLNANKLTHISSTNEYYSVGTPTTSDCSSSSPYQRSNFDSSSTGINSKYDYRSHTISYPTSEISSVDDNYLTRITLNDQLNQDIDLIRKRLDPFPSLWDNSNNNSMNHNNTINYNINHHDDDSNNNRPHLQLPVSLPSQVTFENFDNNDDEDNNNKKENDNNDNDCDNENDNDNDNTNDNDNDNHNDNYSESDNNDNENYSDNNNRSDNDDYENNDDDNNNNNHSDDHNDSSSNDSAYTVSSKINRQRTSKSKYSSANRFSKNVSSSSSASHKASDKQFKCTKCSSSFTRKTRLTEHINRVHMGKIFHFKCNQCGTRLSSKENLTRHTIVHTDKFKCGKCNRRFDRSYRFQRHLEKCCSR